MTFSYAAFIIQHYKYFMPTKTHLVKGFLFFSFFLKQYFLTSDISFTGTILQYKTFVYSEKSISNNPFIINEYTLIYNIQLMKSESL